MTREPWGAVAGALIVLGLGVAVGASLDDAGRPARACPTVPTTPETTTTGTLPPEDRP